MKTNSHHTIVFFDGVCALCNSSVRWIIKRDKKKIFRYAPLQGETARELLHSKTNPIPQTIIYLDSNKIFTKSTAALQITKKLPFAWKLLYGLAIIPAPFRDAVYDYISKNRYKWFGKYESCPLPSEVERDLFLP